MKHFVLRIYYNILDHTQRVYFEPQRSDQPGVQTKVVPH
jgi:hypothetical protein